MKDILLIRRKCIHTSDVFTIIAAHMTINGGVLLLFENWPI